MKRASFLLAAFFLALFLFLLWWRQPPPSPCLAFVEGRIAVAQGRHLAWFGLEGRRIGEEKLPFIPSRLMSVGNALAAMVEGERALSVRSSEGVWRGIAPPPESRGSGIWASGSGRLYYLQPSNAQIWGKALSSGEWGRFLAEGEELENPVDLAPLGEGLVILNRDPPEAVAFDGKGRGALPMDLDRMRLWPLQRPVFEAPLDYLRPRRCDIPRRVWASPGGKVAVLFSSKKDDARRWVLLSEEATGERVVREGLLALRSEGLKRKALPQDLVFVSEDRAVLTSHRGGLWLHDRSLRLLAEWERLSPAPPRWERLAKAWAPWAALAMALLSLLAALWPPTRAGTAMRAIPKRAYGVAFASMILPGLGQFIQRRHLGGGGYVAGGAGGGRGVYALTMRMKAGGFVTPATYIECLLAVAFAWVWSVGEAFFHEGWGEGA